jgi:hypothetical protein
MSIMRRATKAGALIFGGLVSCFTLASGPTIGTQPVQTLSGVPYAARPDTFTCIAYNNVRYWRFPGRDPLGQAHRGQGVDYVSWTVINGVAWWQVNLWGGRPGVWILRKKLTVCKEV